MNHTEINRSKSNRSNKKVLSRRIPRIGKVVFSQDLGPVSCAVKDYTTDSAVLTMSGWLGLPSEFTLYIEPDNIRAQCKVIGRKGSNVKVSLEDVEDDVRYKNVQADQKSSGQISF